MEPLAPGVSLKTAATVSSSSGWSSEGLEDVGGGVVDCVCCCCCSCCNAFRPSTLSLPEHSSPDKLLDSRRRKWWVEKSFASSNACCTVLSRCSGSGSSGASTSTSKGNSTLHACANCYHCVSPQKIPRLFRGGVKGA